MYPQLNGLPTPSCWPLADQTAHIRLCEFPFLLNSTFGWFSHIFSQWPCWLVLKSSPGVAAANWQPDPYKSDAGAARSGGKPGWFWWLDVGMASDLSKDDEMAAVPWTLDFELYPNFSCVFNIFDGRNSILIRFRVSNTLINYQQRSTKSPWDRDGTNDQIMTKNSWLPHTQPPFLISTPKLSLVGA